MVSWTNPATTVATVTILEIIRWAFGLGVALAVAVVTLAALLGFLYGVGKTLEERKDESP